MKVSDAGQKKKEGNKDVQKKRGRGKRRRKLERESESCTQLESNLFNYHLQHQ